MAICLERETVKRACPTNTPNVMMTRMIVIRRRIRMLSACDGLCDADGRGGAEE